MCLIIIYVLYKHIVLINRSVNNHKLMVGGFRVAGAPPPSTIQSSSQASLSNQQIPSQQLINYSQPAQQQHQQFSQEQHHHLQSQNGEWTSIKRGRSSPTEQRRVRQELDNDYWLNATPTVTENRFSPLDNEEIEIDKNSTIKTPKPPPIHVDGVSNITPLINLLQGLAKDQYDIKALENNKVKIQSKSAEAYGMATKALDQKKTLFYTYKPKQERSYKVVLKNLHHSIDTKDIEIEIKNLGHDVINIWNMKQYRTKKPLNMFYVELKPASNNKDIYNIEFLKYYKVKFEAPIQRREIPQCIRCQRYGHTKNFCHMSPRCVKCTGNHLTSDCQRKERSNDVKCVLCDGNHPANYKGCTIYKDIQRNKYPQLRQKQQNLEIQPKVYQKVQPQISYAQTIRGNTQQTQHENYPDQIHNPNTVQQTDDMQEMKTMMKGLMEQMGTILNLLTALLHKKN